MSGITTKLKAYMYVDGANIDANYGPWPSIEAYETFLSNTVGIDKPADATTIAIKDESTGVITKYVYENDQWRVDDTDISDITERVDALELNVGNESLNTSSSTIVGAINEILNSSNSAAESSASAAEESERYALAAQQSAEIASQIVESASDYLLQLKDAIDELPDGQSVSSEVALNIVDINSLSNRQKESERAITGVYLTNDMLYLGYISSDKWKSMAAPYGARYFYVIPIDPGCEIRMVKRYSGSAYARYLLLTDWVTPFHNVAVAYATGYSGIVNMVPSDTTITAPEDAHYLVIFKQFSSEPSGLIDCMLTGLWIDGVDYLGTGLNGAVEELKSKTQTFEEGIGDKENINENITNRDSVVAALNSVFAAIPKSGSQIPYTGSLPADNFQDALSEVEREYLDIKAAMKGINSGKFYGYYSNSSLLPSTDSNEGGYAYVGTGTPFAIWNLESGIWSDSGSTIDSVVGTNEVSPEMYGAKGDGSGDDTDALVSAINSGLPIRMTGTYLISRSIRLANDLFGGGTILYGADDISVYGANDITISDIIFDGAQHNTFLLHLRASDTSETLENVVVENCQFKNIGDTEGRKAGNGAIIIKNCKNISINSCKFSSCQTGSNLGAATFINIPNQQNAVNMYIKIDRCYFNDVKGKDADCVKVIGGNFASYIKVTNCLFANFQKRALKFQAQQCSSMNNSFIINYPCYCVIDFQRGHGVSIGDVFLLDYNSSGIENEDSDVDDDDDPYTKTLAYKIYSMSHGYVTIDSIRVENINASNAKSQALFTLQNFSAYHPAVDNKVYIENVYINNVMAEGLSFLLVNTSQLNEVRNLRMTNVFYKANAKNSAFSLKDAVMVNCHIDITLSKMTNINIFKYHQGSFTNSHVCVKHDYKTLNVVGSNNYIRSENINIVAATYEIQPNGYRVHYLTNDVNPSNKDSTGYTALRNAPVGTIAYIPTPSVVDGRVKVGYICTVAGQDGQTGTFVDYSYSY